MEFPDTQSLANNLPSAGSSYGRNRGVPSSQTYHRPPAMSSMFAFNEPSAPPITDDHQFDVALGPTPHPHSDPTMASSYFRAAGAGGAGAGAGADAGQIKTYGDSRRESSTYLPARRPSQQAQWHARHSGHASSSQPQPHFQSHPHSQPHFQLQSSARSISNSFLPSHSAHPRTEIGTGSSSYATMTAETTPRLSSAPDPSRPHDHSSTEQPWSMGYHTSRGFPEFDQNQATRSEIANHTRKSSDSEGHEHEREVEEEDQDEGDEEDGSEDGSSDDLYGWVQESAAVTMIEDGRGKVVTGDALDMNRSEQLALDLIGITHLILPTTPTPALVAPFLEVVIPSLCASLVVLDISSCNLSHLPVELATLFSLEELDVSNNPLRSLPPSLSELRSLRVLSANEIGCSNLPSSFANLQKLHTLCLRRNRLLSLPSWLGLLPNIETLLVEDNPFHGTWRPLVEQMLIRWSPGKSEDLVLESSRKSSKSESGQGYNSDSHQIQSTASSSIGISSPLSLSPKNVSFLEEDFETMIIPSDHTNSQPDTLQNSSFHNSSAASSPSSSIPRLRSNTVFQSTFSSPVSQPTSLDPRQSAPPDMRRSPNHEDQEDDHSFMQGDSTGRLIPRYHTSLGREGGKLVSAAYKARKPNNHDVLEESPMEDQRASFRLSPGDLAGGGKEKDGKDKDKSKWSFLKKMNIGKTKNVGGGGALGSIDRRPSGPVHSNTASLLEGNARFRRPTIARTATSVSQSTSAGTRGGPLDVSSSSNGSSSKEGFLSPGGLTPEAALLVRQNKRRSYLSLDGPPSLNISIPKTSPFLSTTTFSTVQPIPSPSSMTATEGRNRRLEDGSSVIDSYIQSSENSSTSDHDHDLRHSDSHPLDLSSAEDYRQSQYAAGLHSLMGYLRDLNDLCLPPIVHSPEASMATGFDMSVQMSSPVATSVLSGQTSSSTKGSIRRPTLGSVDMKREFSESSFNFSHNGSSPRFSGIETTHSDESKGERDGPRGFKDDRVKRSRVVQEIYETELTYVRGLRDLVEIYVKPSEVPVVGNSKDTVIPLQERKIAFGGLSGLLQFHEQTFLPKLEAAAAPVLKGGDDLDGSASVKAALGVADVFRTYNPFMRMYSTYINNFPNALQRSSMWMLSSSAPMPSSSPGSPNASSVHVVNMGLTMSAVTPPIPAESQPLASSLSLTTTQRKRIKAFIKRAKQHPRHTQISLDAYLLLPVQRIPRYRMLLSDLMKCTPPQTAQAYDVLEDAFKEMASLASCMNEEKRDAESRQRLVNWQSRIRGRFPSPLVQPHRKLLLDGPLTLIRLVKKNSELAEVVHPIIHDDGGDQTITPSKSLIKVECLGDPDTTVFHLVGVLTSDLFVLCKKDNSTDGSFELFAVLRMQTKAQPASVISGSTIRVVDNRAILYFEAKSPSDALNWVNMLNVSFQITR